MFQQMSISTSAKSDDNAGTQAILRQEAKSSLGLVD
jgi:hypothetical protein